MEVAEVQRLVEQETASLGSIRQDIEAAEREAAAVALKVSEMRGQVLVLEETLLLESFALHVPKFKLNSSYEYKTRLDAVRDRQKAMIKNGEAATGNMGWEVNGSKAEGRKLVGDMLKLVIRSFNNEADYCVDNVKFDNVERGEKRREGHRLPRAEREGRRCVRDLERRSLRRRCLQDWNDASARAQ